MRIDFLIARPEWMATVAGWQHQAFGHFDPSKTLPDRLRTLSGMKRDALPLGLVAHADGSVPLGCASVVRSTFTHAELGPWLSAVYVAPEHRGQGIASALAERAAAECARLGFAELFLFTPHSERLYARLGWETFDRTQIGKVGAAVMRRRVDWR